MSLELPINTSTNIKTEWCWWWFVRGSWCLSIIHHHSPLNKSLFPYKWQWRWLNLRGRICKSEEPVELVLRYHPTSIHMPGILIIQWPLCCSYLCVGATLAVCGGWDQIENGTWTNGWQWQNRNSEIIRRKRTIAWVNLRKIYVPFDCCVLSPSSTTSYHYSLPVLHSLFSFLQLQK